MKFQLRTEAAQKALAGAVLLDYFPGKTGSTIRNNGTDFFADLMPTTAARDLFHLGVAVYCADRVAPRWTGPDGWTREIHLIAPVEAPGWHAAIENLTAALSFLTGDKWIIELRETDRGGDSAAQLDLLPADAVCLFSGGLDSLSGAVDLLEAGKSVVLVGHYESGQAPKRQTELAAGLTKKYGRDKVELRQLFLGPESPTAAQKRPLPDSRENTTRGRSFLFLAAGFALASALGRSVPLYIPENGLIGINVPLTGSRPASLSTRTTHPYFLDLVGRIRSAAGIEVELANPYRLMTKGEMLVGSANQALLRQLAPRSISCAHPEAARWTKNPRRPQGNCGYCYPCLIRKASLHRAGLPGGTYAYDLKSDYALIADTGKGSSLRALVRSLAAPARPADVLRTGPIPNAESAAFGDLYARGRQELLTWLKTAVPKDMRRQLP